MRNCKECGASLEGKRKDAIYCSRECAGRANEKARFRRGRKAGYRSGLEEQIAKQLLGYYGFEVPYEATTIRYTPPVKVRRYTPDFVLPNGIIIETKGRFVTADRQKHIAVKADNPELDIRFVFQNSSARISKKSKTTYADWCRKYGFKYADKSIPEEWLNERKSEQDR